MNDFVNKKYMIIREAVPKVLTDFIYQYFCNRRKVARLMFDTRYISQFNTDWGVWNDSQIPETYSHYGDLVMETLLEQIKPLIEEQAGHKLNANYAYARIYKKGDELKRHKDRWSCEISTTMNLGGDKWPIFLEPSGEEGKKGLEVLLEQGDMLIYKGCELEHWREPFEGENSAQVFLHFNDARKEDANEFDGRPFLGLPTWFKDFTLPTEQETEQKEK